MLSFCYFSTGSWNFIHLFFVYFLFFRLGELIVLSSSMILSCIISILLLSLTSEPLIFFFLLHFSVLQFPFSYFFIASILLRLSIYSIISREFITVFWIIFRRADLKSLENSKIWIILFLGTVLVYNYWRFILVDSAAPCLRYMGDNVETQETHHYVILQLWRSLRSLPSFFHFSETPYTCLLC